jgi:hypothetical protein
VAKKVMVGEINPTTGEQKPSPYTASEGVTDPDGNALLTATAGGGSPVTGLKNATLVGSGSFGVPGSSSGQQRVIVDNALAHRFLWGSCYSTPGGPFVSARCIAEWRAGHEMGNDALGVFNVVQHHFVIDWTTNSAQNHTIFYKVYRIDES